VYERSLREAESMLSTQKEPLLPVRQVWEEILKRSKVQGFEIASLADFSALLDADRRFQIIPAQTKSGEEGESPDDGEMEDVELERLGFCAEDRVRLRNAPLPAPVRREETEEEEEVGSIRRRAFVSKPAVATVAAKKSPAGRANAAKPNGKKKKTPAAKSRTLRRTTAAKKKSRAVRPRGKK